MKQLLLALFLFSCHLILPSSSYADYPPPSSYFNSFNNLLNQNYSHTTAPATIISSSLKYLLVFAGLILFLMIIAGGIQLMFGAGDPKQAEVGKTRITQALIGFVVIFTAYWITQIIEVILGINILQ